MGINNTLFFQFFNLLQECNSNQTKACPFSISQMSFYHDL